MDGLLAFCLPSLSDPHALAASLWLAGRSSLWCRCLVSCAVLSHQQPALGAVFCVTRLVGCSASTLSTVACPATGSPVLKSAACCTSCQHALTNLWCPNSSNCCIEAPRAISQGMTAVQLSSGQIATQPCPALLFSQSSCVWLAWWCAMQITQSSPQMQQISSDCCGTAPTSRKFNSMQQQDTPCALTGCRLPHHHPQLQ